MATAEMKESFYSVVLFQGKSKHFVSLFDAGFMPELEDYGSVEDF